MKGNAELSGIDSSLSIREKLLLLLLLPISHFWWLKFPGTFSSTARMFFRCFPKWKTSQFATLQPEVKDVKAQTLQLAPPTESTGQNIKGEHNSFITLEKFGTLEYSENKTIFHLLAFIHTKKCASCYFSSVSFTAEARQSFSRLFLSKSGGMKNYHPPIKQPLHLRGNPFSGCHGHPLAKMSICWEKTEKSLLCFCRLWKWTNTKNNLICYKWRNFRFAIIYGMTNCWKGRAG